MLVLVTLCWGVSYYLMDLCLADMDPFTLNAHRFLGAFVIAALLSWKKIRTVNRTTLPITVFWWESLDIRYTWARPLASSIPHYPIPDFCAV